MRPCVIVWDFFPNSFYYLLFRLRTKIQLRNVENYKTFPLLKSYNLDSITNIDCNLIKSLYVTGIAACAGVLFGLITMTVQYVGLFVTGFHTGKLLGLATLCLLDNLDQTLGLFTAITSLLAAALFFAIINLHYTKGNVLPNGK